MRRRSGCGPSDTAFSMASSILRSSSCRAPLGVRGVLAADFFTALATTAGVTGSAGLPGSAWVAAVAGFCACHARIASGNDLVRYRLRSSFLSA